MAGSVTFGTPGVTFPCSLALRTAPHSWACSNGIIARVLSAALEGACGRRVQAVVSHSVEVERVRACSFARERVHVGVCVTGSCQ